jgi:hypothetical protein
MKIISLILVIIGFLLCAVSGLGLRIEVSAITENIMRAEASGIGGLASALYLASVLSYVNIFGCLVIFLGIILNIASLFAGKKQNI